ncbi:PREDICTED: uncharacterized protein LOC107070106 isoform X2 [Polistes dominula]|uniref:Uncharacterized protein LOC107070106 isoform X2 n=1 Tax=Polistes dominula TaxID=743375 RepID=A0ABM1ITF9_POLDO|nr:PREDICTED: uncharacterized protein LOC107070106 isoform X2 [Polistes dominula]
MMEFLDTSNKQKYFKNDKVFHTINKQFLSLKENDTKRINSHLHPIIDEILEKMKQDDFFKKVFQRKLFGGSYYKGTKIGAAIEFDIDIIIRLPIDYKLIKVQKSNHPGFVNIHSGLELDKLTNDTQINRSLRKLLDENMYLHQGKFHNWMESILIKAIQTLPKRENKYILKLNDNEYIITIKKSGPAFTFTILFSDNENIDIDLVPVLEFSKSPPGIDHLNSYQKQNWFAVPKPLYNYKGFNGKTQISWRTCFYEQEKEILSKNGYIKQKLRDTQNWVNLASYYIETLALDEVQSNKNLETKSCTILFMEMLHKLHKSLQNKRITYYWDSKFNLLSKLRDEEIVNIKNRLDRILKKIYNSIEDDKYIIASYILNPKELHILKFKDSEECEQPEQTESRCTIF